MQKYKIIIAYDGTDFSGWQIQPTDVTVVSTLQDSFRGIFGHSISIMGASRTDAGVHALGQVAQFRTSLAINPESLRRAWNRGLPKSIFIRNIEGVDDDFHPCANVLQKTYYYHLFLKDPLPFVARYGWLYQFIDAVDMNIFHQGLQLYKGEHDFAAFCKMDDNRSTVKTIDMIKLEKMSRWGMMRVTIKGQGFLRFQIRRMIGYALDVARRDDLSIGYLREVMASKNPQQNLVKAAASGLCLRRIRYKD